MKVGQFDRLGFFNRETNTSPVISDNSEFLKILQGISKEDKKESPAFMAIPLPYETLPVIRHSLQNAMQNNNGAGKKIETSLDKTQIAPLSLDYLNQTKNKMSGKGKDLISGTHLDKTQVSKIRDSVQGHRKIQESYEKTQGIRQDIQEPYEKIQRLHQDIQVSHDKTRGESLQIPYEKLQKSRQDIQVPHDKMRGELFQIPYEKTERSHQNIQMPYEKVQDREPKGFLKRIILQKNRLLGKKEKAVNQSKNALYESNHMRQLRNFFNKSEVSEGYHDKTLDLQHDPLMEQRSQEGMEWVRRYSNMKGNDEKIFSEKILDISHIADKGELIHRISDYIQRKAMDKIDTLDLMARHKDLGEFYIHVNKDSQQIQMKILTSSKEGHSFFMENEPLLLSSLNKAGIKVDQIQLTSKHDSLKTDQQEQSSFSHDRSGEQDSERRKELWKRFMEREA